LILLGCVVMERKVQRFIIIIIIIITEYLAYYIKNIGALQCHKSLWVKN